MNPFETPTEPFLRRPSLVEMSLPIMVFLCVLFFNLAGSAQTCRVSLGVNSEGQRAYMEVYEYDYVTEKPSFPGGDGRLLEFINNHRHYPREAYKAGVQGRVTCSFVVNTNGSISHVKVIKSVEESLNREAMRILSIMPNWHPGSIDNRTVPVRVIWSIPFRK